MRLSYGTDLPDYDPATVFAWHERPGALERLTPPWGEVDVVERKGGIRDGGEVRMRIRRGPSTFHWHVRHSDYVEGRQFRDEQISGPLKSWVHTHRFMPLGGGGTRVQDEIEVEPPLGAAGAAFGPSFIQRELDRLFRFRYRRLATDLARHRAHREQPRLKIAITGASGLIGRGLTSFLTTGGHEVIRFVRDSRKVTQEGARRSAYWNPATGEIDASALAEADAVVHLAGTSIAGGRWTEDRKRSILKSRVLGTELVARTMAETRAGPRVLVSASAVGYYGDRGQEPLDELARSGSGFLAEVCRAWEGATRAAERAGVRVVHLRAGVALSPAGGALGEMLLPFKVGLGGRIGSGKQYVSWIDLDDLIALYHHALLTKSLAGPVNATAPHPVTNATFTSALGRVLGRPTIVPVPSLAVKALFGELGTEALLWGQRVLPRKAVASGFTFSYEGLEESLRFQLGRGAG